MANALYPKYKEAIIQASANSSLTGTVKAVLIDTASYTYSAAHEFYSSASAGAVGTPQTINTKTYTNGTFDGDNVTFTALTGATCEAIIVFIDTGTAGTSRLVAYFDTGVTNLPVTPNGGDVTITWNASGIFSL
jgi:hypothetical protein